MATYAFDYYGASKYGARQFVDFGVDPFTATVLSYRSVQVRWNTPGGSWSAIRLVRSRSGYAVSENDGVILFDQPVQNVPPTQYVDSDLSGGWIYYTIFLLNGVRWERASTVSVLVPFDYESAEKLISLTPEYYRLVRDNAAGFSASQYEMNPQIYLSSTDTLENDQFTKFMNIFGWGFDLVRTHIDSTLDGYNPDTIHLNRLALLADQFGAALETSVPAHKNRSLVRNLALIYRKKGTLSGIREAMTLATGWDVDVYSGVNLMLNTDQSEFDSPDVNVWNANTRYVIGDFVLFGLWYFRAKATAYGSAQSPPFTQTDNTWWDAAVFAQVYQDTSQVRDDTSDVSTWQIYNPATKVAIPGRTSIGMGMKHPTDPQAVSTNALSFRNTTGSTVDLVARSIPLAADSPTLPNAPGNLDLVIGSGIPVPRVTARYSALATYDRGAQVRYLGSPYEALSHVEGIDPTDTTHWKRLGLDSRVRLNVSYYAHGPFVGTAGTGSLQTYPYITAFDERGKPLVEFTCSPTTRDGVFYDPFYDAGPITSARTVAVSTTASGWSSPSSDGWMAKSSEVGGNAYSTSVSRTLRVINAGTANGRVSVRFSRVGSRKIGLVFRYADDNNYYFATQTGVTRRNNGGDTVVFPWNELLVTGDRLIVDMSGSSMTFYRNSLDTANIGIVVSGFNSTSTYHGVFMEAVA